MLTQGGGDSIKKILSILVVGIFLASTIAVGSTGIDISVETNDEKNVLVDPQENNEDCGCPQNYMATGSGHCKCDFVNGYAIMSYLPPKSQEALDMMIIDPQPTVAGEDLPSSFSWKNFGGDWTTSAKDQQSCGSCWAFGALGAMEAAINIASGEPGKDVDLSEQYVLACLSEAGSCSGGWMSEALMYILSTDSGNAGNGINGCPRESCMPYQAVDYIPCSDKCSDWDYYTTPPADDNILFQIKSMGVTSINPTDPSGWDVLKSWVYTYGPIVLDIYASSGWSSFGNSNHDPNAVYYGTESSTTNHAQVLCGWVDTPGNPNYQGYWILKNSWGTDFGYGGFTNVAYGCLRVGDRDVSWVTTKEWPHAQPPDTQTPVKYVYADWDYESKYPRLGDDVEFIDSSKGPVVMWEWDFNDDGIVDSTSKRPKQQFHEEGEHKVTLTVTASSGLDSTLSKLVGVKEIWPPTAVSKPDYYGGNDNVVHFEGRYSYDGDGSIKGYAWDFDGDGVTDSTESHFEYTFPDQNGEHLVTLTVTDNEGATDTAEIKVKIDKTVPPETVALVGGINQDENMWFKDNVRVDLAATDWSGLSKLHYKIDNDDWDDVYCFNEREFVLENLVIRGHGIHTVQFYSVDKYGNTESTHSANVKIDMQQPSVDISISNQQGNVYLPPATVTIIASDDDSGVSIVKYWLDGILNDYASPFTVSQGGTHVLEVLVEDIAGNQYYEQISFMIEHPPNAPDIQGPNSGTSGTEYTFDFTATDPFGEDISYYIEWGDGQTTGWTQYFASGTKFTDTHVWTSDGAYTVRAKAKDTNGAESEWETQPISMPKNSSPNLIVRLLQKLIDLFPILEPLLQPVIDSYS